MAETEMTLEEALAAAGQYRTSHQGRWQVRVERTGAYREPGRTAIIQCDASVHEDRRSAGAALFALGAAHPELVEEQRSPRPDGTQLVELRLPGSSSLLPEITVILEPLLRG